MVVSAKRTIAIIFEGNITILHYPFVQAVMETDFCFYLARSSQKATALAAATFSESTPCHMGIFTV